MVKVDRSSEPYSDYGNLSGQGARRLLGAPSSDPLVTAIRETVQNSWDARVHGGKPKYGLRLRTLSDDEKKALRDVMFRDLSTDPDSGLKLVLKQQSIRVLDIIDRGTVGLDGPVRSSALARGEASRFVKFLRNIGGPREAHSLSGGTYGYGKSSLFALSNCETVVVDSVTRDQHGTSARRFMAARMGEEFHDGEAAYTGRHWWGRRANDGVVDPIFGSEADCLAGMLGMPGHDGESGTTITVIEPDLGDESEDLERAADRMVRALLWYFWPKMVDGRDQHVPMDFHVRCEGWNVPIPKVRETLPFSLFADALEAVREGSEAAIPIRSQRPKRLLGWMAESRGFREERLAVLQADSEPRIPETSHHVALMRPAELVVKYLVGNRLPDSRLEWAGVFICSDEDEVEAAFAAAEPPAHDDWVPQHLPGRSEQKTFVNVALRRVREEMERISPEAMLPSGGDFGGFAPGADAIGRALLEPMGDRAVKTQPGPGGSSSAGSRRIRLRQPEFAGLTDESGHAVASFQFEITGPAGRKVAITASPSIVTEGRERLGVAPNGELPRIVRWRIGDSTRETGTARIRLTLPEGPVRGVVSIRMPNHMAITPGLKVDPVNDG